MPRDAAPPSRFSLAKRYHRGVVVLRPYWALLAVVILVLASAPFAIAPVRDAVTLVPIAEATLRRPLSYVLLAPLSDVLDLLTLLSLRQHVALLLTLLLGYAAWWGWRGRVIPVTVAPRRRGVRLAARLGLAALALLAVYGAAVLLPRPMAALEVAPDVLTVDFHAHTKYSHDGRPDWGPEDVRAWHRDAGFAAAFITDHRTFEGARDAWANNPGLAGEGVSLLPAIEVVWKGEHVNVLDADRTYRGILTETLRDIDDAALALASAVPGNEPLLVQTLPGDLSKMIPADGPGTAGVRAIELVDGAPKGLGQTRRERARIIHLADSLGLAHVAGSDHHGWGHTAAGWTLLYLPNWRSATPDELTDAIVTILRRGALHSTKVVERYVPYTESGVALPFTAPLVLWGMLRTLSRDERMVWIVWALLIFLVARYGFSRRAATDPAR
ncbi:MAG: PHP domain-containing protein [Gemmatimonadales bacterium]